MRKDFHRGHEPQEKEDETQSKDADFSRVIADVSPSVAIMGKIKC